jgi:hypothetical protein
VRRNRSTRSGGIAKLERFRRSKHPKRGGTCRTLRAVAHLVRSWRRLAHVPTLMQVRALAHFGGREPCSYLLDPTVNYVPELPLGGEDPLGRHALCFTGRHPDSGRRFELVTLPDGCAFDLLDISGWQPADVTDGPEDVRPDVIGTTPPGRSSFSTGEEGRRGGAHRDRRAESAAQAGRPD